MWATADESREEIMALWHRCWAHADATISALGLDDLGAVPWWSSERNTVTLHQILIHMIAETHRHAGHADIVRELIDGAAGFRVDNDNMPELDQAAWRTYHDRLESVAREAATKLGEQPPGA